MVEYVATDITYFQECLIAFLPKIFLIRAYFTIE